VTLPTGKQQEHRQTGHTNTRSTTYKLVF